ncbi:MAG: hypothetical protein ACFB0B_09130 [Thermonemataceae bacterium]
MNTNKGQCKNEKFVNNNPLLRTHATVSSLNSFSEPTPRALNRNISNPNCS